MTAETRIEKLRAMAAQTSSPHEAEVARKMLADLGVPEKEAPKEPERRCAFRGCTRPPEPDARGLAWVCKRHQQDMGFSPPRHVPDPFEAAARDDYERLAKQGRYRDAVATGVDASLRPRWAPGPVHVKVDAPFD